MNLKLPGFIIIINMFILLFGQTVHAHGLTYGIEQLGQNKIRVNIQDTAGSDTGFVINHLLMKDAKTLYVGYARKSGYKTSASFEYDLTSAVPPIKIILKDIDENSKPLFDDISGSEAEECILHLHDAGIANGRSERMFCPKGTLSRAEIMVFIVKACGLKAVEGQNVNFRDIDNHWGRKYIQIAVQNGIFKGYSDNTIRPDNEITLAEACTVIARSFSFKTINERLYSKLTADRWYSSYVKGIFDSDILKVTDSIYNGFDEEERINRANWAIMLSRALSTY